MVGINNRTTKTNCKNCRQKTTKHRKSLCISWIYYSSTINEYIFYQIEEKNGNNFQKFHFVPKKCNKNAFWQIFSHNVARLRHSVSREFTTMIMMVTTVLLPSTIMKTIMMLLLAIMIIVCDNHNHGRSKVVKNWR